MKVFCVAALLCALGSVKGDTVVLNQLVDEVLASANELVMMTGKSTIPVPTISTNWHKRWHFIKVSGSLSCDNGQVGQLNTLKRTGDATMTTNGNTVTINAHLGLGNFNFDFGKCRAKVHHILSVSSKVSGQIESESISLQLSLTYSENKNGKQCSAKLDSIKLDSIGKVQLKTGGGEFHKVVDKLLDLITNHLRGDMKNSINRRLTPIAQQAVAKKAAKICQEIPHL